MIPFAEKIVEELVKLGTGSAVDQFLRVKRNQRAFKQALESAHVQTAQAGFKTKGLCAIDLSFYLDRNVMNELWFKLLDPAVDEPIDYGVLYEVLGSVYGQEVLSDEDTEAVEFFVDALLDSIRSDDSLRSLRIEKVAIQHDNNLTLRKQKALVNAYLDTKLESLGREFLDGLGMVDGEPRPFIEPLIEQRIAPDPDDSEGYANDRSSPEDSARRNGRFEKVDFRRLLITGGRSRIGLIADSGLGKTAFMMTLFLNHALRIKEGTPQDSARIPIYLTPSQAVACTEDNIISVIAAHLRWSECRKNKVTRFTEIAYDSGRFVILMDALDQVANRQLLCGLLEGDTIGSNVVVVSSRPAAWKSEKGHLARFTEFHLREFDEKRWQEYLSGAELENVRETTDNEFLRIPVLLKLLSQYWLREGNREWPVNRAQLYGRVLDKLLTQQAGKDAVRAASGRIFEPDQAREDLRSLAYWSMVDRQYGQLPRSSARKIVGREPYSDLVNHSGVLQIIEATDEVHFRHRSFQEFLAAEYLSDRVLSGEDISRLDSYLLHPEWNQVIRFLAGMLDRDTAIPLIKRMLLCGTDKPIAIYLGHLRLAISCLNERQEGAERLRVQVVSLLEKEADNPLLTYRAVDLLSQLKGNLAEEALLKAASHEDWYVRSAAVSKLARRESANAVDLLVRSLKDDHPDVRAGAARTLGEMKAENAVQPLIEAMNDEKEHVLASVIGALGELKAAIATDAIIKGYDAERYEIRSSSLFALSSIATETAISFLLSELKSGNEDVRTTAVTALGKTANPDTLEGVFAAVLDPVLKVREAAVKAMSGINSTRTINTFMSGLQDENPTIKTLAVFVLGKLRHEAATDLLIPLLEHKDPKVRTNTAMALGEIGLVRAVSALTRTAKDNDVSVRALTIDALGKIGSHRSESALIETLGDTDAGIRWLASCGLKKIKSRRAIDPLMKALKDKDPTVRWHAADALGEIGCSSAVDSLLEAMTDQVAQVRWNAAEALGKIGSEKAVSRLLEGLEDSDSFMRHQSAKALGRIGSDRAIKPVVELFMKGDEVWVTGSALHALADMATSDSLKVLVLLWDRMPDRWSHLGAIEECDTNLRRQERVKPLPQS